MVDLKNKDKKEYKKKPNKVFKQVSSQQEFDREYKNFKKDTNKLFKKGFKFLKDPQGFIDAYEGLLSEYQFKGVISEEWASHQRKRLYRELNKPEEFRELAEKTKANIKRNKDKALNFITNKKNNKKK